VWRDFARSRSGSGGRAEVARRGGLMTSDANRTCRSSCDSGSGLERSYSAPGIFDVALCRTGGGDGVPVNPVSERDRNKNNITYALVNRFPSYRRIPDAYTIPAGLRSESERFCSRMG
jgi:hypothetical protein